MHNYKQKASAAIEHREKRGRAAPLPTNKKLQSERSSVQPQGAALPGEARNSPAAIEQCENCVKFYYLKPLLFTLQAK